MSSLVYWAVCLIAAHLIADFPLQSDKMIDLKRTFPGKILHAAMHGLLSYLLCSQWNFWYLPLIIAVSHGFIDLIDKKTWQLYLIDQCMHFCVIAACLLMLPFSDVDGNAVSTIWYFKVLVIVSGVIVLTKMSGILISKFMERLALKSGLPLIGLPGGGMWIGNLERLLILILILFNMSAGIGFLIAAKSILRFNETKDEHKIAEYVLIGTFLSYMIAIPVSLLVSCLV